MHSMRRISLVAGRAPKLVGQSFHTASVARLAQPAAASAAAASSKSPASGLGPLATPRAQDVEAKWRGTSTSGGTTKNYVEGRFVDSATKAWVDVHDPATQTVLTRVPETTPAEFDEAVASAARAFPDWRETSLLGRQAVMLKLQALLRDHMDDIANSITLEQ